MSAIEQRANISSCILENTVSDETVMYSYWTSVTWPVSYRPVLSSERAPYRKNNKAIVTKERIRIKSVGRKINSAQLCTYLLQRHFGCLRKRIVRLQRRKHMFCGWNKLRELTETWSMCAMLCAVTDERVFRRYRRNEETSAKLVTKQIVSSGRQYSCILVVGRQKAHCWA
jgi:hypothetical protein